MPTALKFRCRSENAVTRTESDLSRAEHGECSLRWRRRRTVSYPPKIRRHFHRNGRADGRGQQRGVRYDARLCDRLVRGRRYLAATGVMPGRINRTLALTAVRAVGHYDGCESAGRAQLHREKQSQQDDRRLSHDFNATPGPTIGPRTFSLSGQLIRCSLVFDEED
jgi:hypothetical protein